MTPAREAGSSCSCSSTTRAVQTFVGTEDGLEPLAAGDVTVENGTSPPPTGTKCSKATDSQGSTSSSRTSSSRPATTASFGPRGSRPRSSSRRRFATTRRPTSSRTSRPVSSSRTTGRDRTSTASGGARAGVADQRRARELQGDLHRPADPRAVLSRVRLDVRLRRLSVLFTFALGLFLAIALNKHGLRFQGLQRSLLIIPYAIPGFLSLLVWRGLLNDDFGVVNRHPARRTCRGSSTRAGPASRACSSTSGSASPTSSSSAPARSSPSPDELTEAARVDGAGALPGVPQGDAARCCSSRSRRC